MMNSIVDKIIIDIISSLSLSLSLSLSKIPINDVYFEANFLLLAKLCLILNNIIISIIISTEVNLNQ